MKLSLPEPSKADAIAAFRLGIVGDLLARELAPGELQVELEAKAEKRYRPPGAASTRKFNWKTLQNWFYRAKHHGLQGLRPASRAKGHGLALTSETRELLLQIRREHPSAPANLILTEAVRQGVVAEGELTTSTLRRVFADAGLSRESIDRHDRLRRKWVAAHVGALWHGDVCHIWVRDTDGTPRRFFVHGLMDDHSRYVVALEAREAEREVDLLSVLCGSLLRFPAPEALYVDNGSCYRGDVLAVASDRLGIRLVHAGPYDPQARGKQERFWRTFRMRCADHLPAGATLQEVNEALLAWLDADYHVRPHASLMGETPARRFHAGLRALGRPRTAKELAKALEISITRKIRNDLTLDVDGETWELLATRGLAAIRELFVAERVVMAAPIEERLALREELCRPILDGIRRWVDEELPRAIPRTPMHGALQYLDNQWERLCVFLEHAAIACHNNDTERDLRRPVKGKANYHFAGSPRGADVAAVFYSLIGTCLLQGIDPRRYLHEIAGRLDEPPSRLTPHAIRAEWLAAQDRAA